MKTNEQIQELVTQWAAERGINDPVRQALKFGEEYGELCGHYLKGMDITDDIGDTAITIILLAHMGEATFHFVGNDKEERDSADVTLSEIPNDLLFAAQWAVSRLIDFTEMVGYNFNVCLNHAWNEIKNRKGKTVDGTFIREDVR